MAEQLNNAAAHVIVMVRMADDIHHVLTRMAIALWAVAGFFVLAVVMDSLASDWRSAFFSALPVVAFGLAGRESWGRRTKYAKFVKAVQR